jgi:mannitol-1-phosphate/altronate dehydrogenase
VTATPSLHAPHRLSRSAGDGRPAAPVRVAHLGLGTFFRAHEAWYTEHAPDAQAWGIAAFTGRTAVLAEAMAPQDGLYTLVTQRADGDAYEVVSSVSAVHGAAELPADEIAEYRAALVAHFTNPRIRHLLAQIATDGSLKLPVRILPTQRHERTAGRMPPGAVRTLAAWVRHLRGEGAPVDDPVAGMLTADEGLVRAVVATADDLVRS